MAQTAVVVEILRYRQVAIHVEQNAHVSVWCFAYLGCDCLPAVVNLDKAEVMTFILI